MKSSKTSTNRNPTKFQSPIRLKIILNPTRFNKKESSKTLVKEPSKALFD
jgi:hypothetical protein